MVEMMVSPRSASPLTTVITELEVYCKAEWPAIAQV